MHETNEWKRGTPRRYQRGGDCLCLFLATHLTPVPLGGARTFTFIPRVSPVLRIPMYGTGTSVTLSVTDPTTHVHWAKDVVTTVKQPSTSAQPTVNGE